MPDTLELSGLITFTLAIMIFFVGGALNSAIAPLRSWNIPEAVTGGILAALVTLTIYIAFDIEIHFDLAARDMLLLYFFTGIGLNAKFSDLATGGRPLVFLLIITVVFLVVQNVVALGGSALMGLPDGVAPLLGSISLVGGHGTTIAWAPIISERYHITNAMEIGIASATLGLVLASVLGGPIAGVLIRRYNLHNDKEQDPIVGLSEEEEESSKAQISYRKFLTSLLVLNIVIAIGYALDEMIEEMGVNLPLFVICLLVAIVFTNIVPHILPKLEWPARTPELALISELSLNIFLPMSLMAMKLWALDGLGFSLLAVLIMQTVVTVGFIFFVVFPAMGRNYQAAVLSAGFTGIGLGATPTAIANMTAVTRRHGPAPLAFIILPLISAFFIDLVNALVIAFMMQ
ncbi:sodium/glutamate symporter [Xanthobacter sp. TB0139]|uniref:sodium/glutamate symporter n=1 Tax=Xanthobacter sp. TB0139 TaxID=3459178 RepID=UPI004039D43E